MSEWRKVKLGDCIEEINERTTENNQYEVLTSSKSGIYSQEEYFDKQVASKDNTGYKIIKKGEFTYRSMSDNGTFTINRLENKEIGIVSPAYPVFRTTNINAEYLKYFFQSAEFSKAIYNLSQGSTRTALKYKDLANIDIQLPQIEEQEKIINVIEKIDLIIEKVQNEIVKNERVKEGIFRELLKKYTNKVLKLRNVIDYKKGFAFKSNEYRENGIRIIRVSDLGKKEINDECNKIYIDEKDKKIYEGYELKDKDIIVTTVGSKPPIYDSIAGRAIIVDAKHEGTLLNQNTVRLRIKDNISPILVFTQLNGKKYYNYLSLIMRGNANQGNITIEELLDYEISILEESVRNKVEKIIDIYNNKKILLLEKKLKYKNLKKGLMQKLLTGKVRVKI